MTLLKSAVATKTPTFEAELLHGAGDAFLLGHGAVAPSVVFERRESSIGHGLRLVHRSISDVRAEHAEGAERTSA